MYLKTLVNLTSVHPNAKLSFYQHIIHDVFSPMKLGRLVITLPDGQRLIYGDGGEVQADIQIYNPVFFKKCVLYGDVGFGESFVDGDWDSSDVTKVIEWMILNVENHPTLMADKVKSTPVNFLSWINRIQHIFRDNSLIGSRKNIEEHYDLSNDFFKLFLDPGMTYSSAYFKNSTDTLEEAQITKYDALCRKLKLKPKDHVLEIGSGWGGLAVYAAQNYGCKVTTVTISKKQFEYAKKRIANEKLSDKISIELKDYRSIRGVYDKIISIEMIEAVGDKYLGVFFKQCHDLLKKDGLLGLQMILSPDHRYDSFRKNVDWIQKHIFPGSLLPSMSAIQSAIRSSGTMCLTDYEDMTPSYVKTLSIWKNKFNENLKEVRGLGFDESFIRKWNYYKSYCMAAFRMRNIFVAQAVFSRPNNLSLDIS